VKKLVIATGLIAIFTVGSFVTIPAHGIDRGAGLANSTDSIAPGRSASERLLIINKELSPDDVILDDWLCDGMTPCVELSPRQRD
jgi:hypothetical protein